MTTAEAVRASIARLDPHGLSRLAESLGLVPLADVTRPTGPSATGPDAPTAPAADPGPPAPDRSVSRGDDASLSPSRDVDAVLDRLPEHEVDSLLDRLLGPGPHAGVGAVHAVADDAPAGTDQLADLDVSEVDAVLSVVLAESSTDERRATPDRTLTLVAAVEQAVSHLGRSDDTSRPGDSTAWDRFVAAIGAAWRATDGRELSPAAAVRLGTLLTIAGARAGAAPHDLFGDDAP